MSEMLKPCPFCGETEDVTLYFAEANQTNPIFKPAPSGLSSFGPPAPHQFYVRCDFCGATTETFADDAVRGPDWSLQTKDGRTNAIDAWNQRADPRATDGGR